MRFFPLILLSLLVSVPLLAAPPSPQGNWAGRELGPKNAVSLYFSGPGMVFVDRKEVLLAHWEFSGPGRADGKGTVYPALLTFHRISNHSGRTWIAVKGNEANAHALLRFEGRKLRLCIAKPGSGTKPALQPNPRAGDSRVRCFDLARPSQPIVRAKRPRSRAMCLRQCIMDNQMRAVAIERIEADCREQCRGAKQ